MLIPITRPAGTARVDVWSVALGRGFDIPAGPCTLEVPADIVSAIPGAVVTPTAPVSTPATPAEE